MGAALEAALHVTPRVYMLDTRSYVSSQRCSREFGVDDPSQALLDLAARVRDIGMVGLPDRVVLATAPRSPQDWELVNQHPVIEERNCWSCCLVGPLPRRSCDDITERWDGGGYPDGLAGDAIPKLVG